MLMLLSFIAGFGQKIVAIPSEACEIYKSKNKRDPEKRRDLILTNSITTHELNRDSVLIVRYKYNSDKIKESYYCTATTNDDIGEGYLIAEVIKGGRVKPRMLSVTDPDLKIYLLNCPD